MSVEGLRSASHILASITYGNMKASIRRRYHQLEAAVPKKLIQEKVNRYLGLISAFHIMS